MTKTCRQNDKQYRLGWDSPSEHSNMGLHSFLSPVCNSWCYGWIEAHKNIKKKKQQNDLCTQWRLRSESSPCTLWVVKDPILPLPTAALLCPWARHFTPRKYWLITQEAVAPSRHDWKIVDWDVKPQHKQTNNPSSGGQRRYWLDWSDARADLSLHLAYMSFCWFVVLWLILMW